MKRTVLLSLLSMAMLFARAQEISYDISFPNLVHHEALISVTVTGVKSNTLTFRMSRSSPGRYATHEFGKNVYDVHLLHPVGLWFVRTAGDVYQVTGISDSVTLVYTLYGNYADGTYCGIDVSSIHLNMPAAFMWVEELQHTPIEVTFHIPDPSFTIATQLKPGSNRFTFSAPDLQYLMDSPTKIGNLHWREWTVSDKDRTQTIRLALEAVVTETEVDSLAKILKRVTAQAAKVFGAYPRYDYGTYTFIASINPYVHGDGMEHRNSTMITTGRPFALNARNLGVFAHEYFHSWNVERIRPKTLEPFNFTHSNMSNELWIAEGFTQYYGELLMRRALVAPDTTFAPVAARFINSKVNTPGGLRYTPIQASNMAVFTDAGVSIDATNFDNIFNSYYFYGAAIALALDLQLRSEYKHSLDDVMQLFWQRNGTTEKPYNISDLQQCVAAVSSERFATTFFNDYVFNAKVPAYQKYLPAFGYQVAVADPGAPWLGDFETRDNMGVVIASNTIRNTPAYNAGLDIDDEITSADGKQVINSTSLANIIQQHRPGDRFEIRYLHRGKENSTTVILEAAPYLQLVPMERTATLTGEAIRMRSSWLSPK